MMYRTASAAFVLCCLLPAIGICYASRIIRSTASLKISPEGGTFKAQAGKPFVLSCLGDGGNAKLFTDVTWYNPRGEKIFPTGKISVDLTNNGEKLMLSFMDPSLNDAGNYRCEGNFQNSEKLQASINVIVYEGVTFRDCPEVQQLVKGDEQSKIRCTASANPKADITWLKDTEALDNLRYVVDNSGLKIRGASAEVDGGTFTVRAVVMETGQFLEKTITVEVHVRPEIVDLNKEYELIEDEEATLSCHAAATPLAHYSWFDNRKRNVSEVYGFIMQRDKGDLVIKKVTKDMDGEFTCIAENGAGRAEGTTSVNVITKPLITGFGNVSVPEGQTATIVCRASGNPTPTLSIRREGLGQEALRASQNRISLEAREERGESLLTLHISDLDKGDDGLYYCSAENKAGKSEQAGHLQVEYKPNLSANPTVVKAWYGNPKNITCLAYSIPNATISWYNAMGQELRNDATFRVFSEPGRSTLQVSQAAGANVYAQYRCEAANRHGRAEHYISLSEAFPPGPIEKANIVKLSPQSVTFIFDGPQTDGGLPLIRYHVYYHETIYGSADEGATKSWPAGTGPYLLDGLKPSAQYSFRFAGENEVGIGPLGADMSTQLPMESQPESPTIIRDDQAKDAMGGDILSRYSNRFTIRWTEPNSNGRPLDSYDISYTKVEKNGQGDWEAPLEGKMETTIPAGDDLQYTLDRLRPSSFYRVQLSARNALGNSLPSSLVFKTADFIDGNEDALGEESNIWKKQTAIRTPDKILIAPDSVDLIIWILIASSLAFFLIIDLVCCVSHGKGVTYLVTNCICVRRCATLPPRPRRGEHIVKPAKESAV
ncbi:Fasciclin-2 [Halotydeus destructor]|nr:Fasciclin-2 [Halotydeus destructor]